MPGCDRPLTRESQAILEGKIKWLTALPYLWSPPWWVAVPGCFVVLLPFLTWMVSDWRFRRTCSSPVSEGKGLAAPPVTPYYDVFFGNLLDLILNTQGFLLKVIGMARQGPIGVAAGFAKLTVVSNPDQIQKVFRASKQLSNKRLAVFALQYLFGASREIAELFENHTIEESGSPKTDQGEQHLTNHVSGFSHYAREFLSGTHLQSLSKRYLANISHNSDQLNIQENWVRFPDLFVFLQGLVTPAAIEALMGAKIFEVNPNIVDDFWYFERGAPRFLRGFPRWLMPSRYRARDRIFDTMKKLDELAAQQDLSRLAPDDPEWEPYLGSKFLRARHEYSNLRATLPAKTKAWEKMGILFGANANLVPSMFWYVFEALKDPHLADRMLAEISSCVTTHNTGSGSGRDFHLEKLLEQPLLQSAYAETLRLRVAIALPRTVEHGDFNLAGYKIEENRHILMFTWPIMQDEEAWARAGKPPLRPFDQFWAERFLVPKQQHQQQQQQQQPVAGGRRSSDSDGDVVENNKSGDYEFSLRGLAGRWIPYGGGQHLCPGRHFAKVQLIVTFAFLFSRYDTELLDEARQNEAQPDMRWFPTGALPPDRQVPFRIRKRQGGLL
ncbi:cytochrome P450 [Apiospora saccharicola]|uniref:Cytochrome P450 n=1 Tax=Apiospora saccharicola TaxID=335842 RepID=A0ABR1U2T6_9PEZI